MKPLTPFERRFYVLCCWSIGCFAFWGLGEPGIIGVWKMLGAQLMGSCAVFIRPTIFHIHERRD